VAIRKASEAHAVLSKGWLWPGKDAGKDAGWISVRTLDIVPGMTIMLPTIAGGYRTDVGWTGSEEDKPVASIFKPAEVPSDPELLSSLDHGWQSIEQHTVEVSFEWLHIMEVLGGAGLAHEEQHAVLNAVYWHDTGKNHGAWRCAAERAFAEAGISVPKGLLPIAKFSLADSPHLKERNDDGSPKFSGDALKKKAWALRQSFRPGIAHEVASALAFRQSEQAAHFTHRPIQSLLGEYLVMSHHGRVRKVLRDEIPRQPRKPKDTETVRGVSNGDELPQVAVAGQTLGCASLSTDCRRMGRDADGHESYTKGVLRLLDHYGPFRLAFYEALFRAADMRASKRAREEKPWNPSF
jgi:CRISPR-associated endonuclease/helicase Cas3